MSLKDKDYYLDYIVQKFPFELTVDYEYIDLDLNDIERRANYHGAEANKWLACFCVLQLLRRYKLRYA